MSVTDNSQPEDRDATDNSADHLSGGRTKLRVDIWLWAVRQVRTRSMATTAAKAGHVRVNGDPAKPSTAVRVGDEVRFRFQGFDRILIVKQLPHKRLGAPLAQQCYRDDSPPRPRYVLPPALRDPGAGRPTKRERRQLEQLRGEEWTRHSRRDWKD